MNYVLQLLNSKNEKVVSLGILIEQITKAIEEKTITQSECDELLADTSTMQKLIEDSISLEGKYCD